MKKIKELYTKYREFILYAICGVFTTISNFLAFQICTFIFGERLYLFNNAIAWIAGVAVAFVTNKIYVFESKSWKPKVALKEFFEFVAARLFSFFFEQSGMFLCITVLKLGSNSFLLFDKFTVSGQLIIKILLSIVVVILNYLFSKFVVFKKKKTE